MAEIEDLLRATLFRHESDITSPPTIDPRKPSRCRTSVASTSTWLPPAVGALTIIGALAVVAVTSSEAQTAAAHAPVEPVGAVRLAPIGLQAVSSLGLELLVPSDWAVDGTGQRAGEGAGYTGCRQTSAPSVVREAIGVTECLTPESAAKTVVKIGTRDADWLPSELLGLSQQTLAAQGATSARDAMPALAIERTTVDGRPVERGYAELPDGRVVVLLRWMWDDVSVVVRTPDIDVASEIVASAHLVDVDSVGCPTARPAALEFLAHTRYDPLPVLDMVQSASLCFYPVSPVGIRLYSSAVVDGSDMTTLMTELGRLTFRSTVDASSCAAPRGVPEESIVIALRLTGGSTRYVVLAEHGCETVAFAAMHEGSAAVSAALDHLLVADLLRTAPAYTR